MAAWSACTARTSRASARAGRRTVASRCTTRRSPSCIASFRSERRSTSSERARRGPDPAAGAGAAQRDVVVADLELRALRDPVDRALELGVLERRDLAAVLADEVVVMMGATGVGRLEAGDAVTDLDTGDELEPFELLQDPVDRGPPNLARRALQPRLHLERRQRAAMLGKDVDDRPTGAAAAVAGGGQLPGRVLLPGLSPLCHSYPF